MTERVPEKLRILISVAVIFVLESALLTKVSVVDPCSGYSGYFADDYKGVGGGDYRVAEIGLCSQLSAFLRTTCVFRRNDYSWEQTLRCLVILNCILHF